ncbi:NAD-dependent epimerase/dehydratase family protein [Pseudazoarcus pumilus]|uniref:NAD-dependent epimerase/dehydratase family protein n=1 Tax=Pseudazoarcus pumilus TaxID=2067960 RepID=UPI0013D9931F|nr:NAD-dependent epimerase/dehydratase family protein [Pseudazoarcus pumilus]
MSEARRRVLVTGAGGFLGTRIAAALDDGFEVVRMFRHGNPGPGVAIADLDDERALARACEGVAFVVHCAGHAHAHGARDDAAAHERINRLGTRRLAEAAVAAGVRHLVFLSSVKAAGHPGGAVADESWPAPPDTPYGRSKRAAEDALAQLCADSPMVATSLRLAMVYGHGSRGNLERMLAGIRAGWFPPLPHTCGPRSMVHAADVVAAVRAVLGAPTARSRTFIVADAEPHTAARIYDLTRALLGLSPMRWRVPAAVLRAAGHAGDAAGRLLRRRMPLDTAAVSRLLDPECYSPRAIERELGWRARVALADGLREALGGELPRAVP